MRLPPCAQFTQPFFLPLVGISPIIAGHHQVLQFNQNPSQKVRLDLCGIHN